MRRALWLLVLLASPAWATDYYADAVSGVDPSPCAFASGGTCGAGTGAAACKTINCALTEIDFGAGDRLVAVGTFMAGATSTTIADITSGDADMSLVAGTGGAVFSGLQSSTLNDANWVACDASANCNGDSTTSTYVFRQSVTGRTITRVYELTTSGAHSSLFTVDCGSEPMAWTWEAPVPMSDCSQLLSQAGTRFSSSWDCVKKLPHSYWINGTNLLVHFADNEQTLSAAQSSHDVETSPLTNVISVGASGVTIDGVHTKYSGGTTNSGAQIVLNASADGLTLKNGSASSGGFGGLFGSTIGTDNTTIQDFNFHDTGMRPMCTSDADSCPSVADPLPVGQGYCHSSGGIASSWAVAIGGSSSTTVTANLTMQRVNIWNAVSNLFTCDQCDHALLDKVMAKNCPNHSLYFQTRTDPSAACTANTIRRSGAWNAQDGIVLANSVGCTGNRVLFSFSSGKVVGGGDDGFPLQATNSGATYRGNLATAGIKFGNASGDGASSNRNWLNNSGTKCLYSTFSAPTSTNVQCTSGWGNGFDTNSLFGSSVDLKLAGFNGAGTWPPSTTAGLTASTWTLASFVPLIGSPLIDAGGLDYDGDRADDDLCDSSTGCYGAAFDIGPGEYQPAASSAPPATITGATLTGASTVTGGGCMTAFTETFESGTIAAWPVWLQQLNNASNGFETTTVRSGTKAFRFVVDDLDLVDGTTRAELLRFNHDRIGCDAYYGWSFYIPTSYVDSTLFQIIGQWHPPVGVVGQPMISWQVQTATVQPPSTHIALGLFMRKNTATPSVVAFTDVTKGAWHDIVTHVNYSTDNSVGYVEAWLDGALFTTGTSGKEFGATSDVAGGTTPGFVSFGLYRSTSITSENTVYGDEFRVGDTRSSVAIP